MTTTDMLSINNVAAKLGLSVHQLRRWELMFGLDIKRGRGQQRQYREEDLSVLERIKELVEQGWPTSQIRPQLEAEGLVTPKLIGVPPAPGNPEVLQESIIGLRNFTERRFIEISKQIDELRQLLISVTLKQELSTDKGSPWQPMASEYVPAQKVLPPQEITIGPQISIDPPAPTMRPPNPVMNQGLSRPIIGSTPQPRPTADASPDSDAVARSMSTLNSIFKEGEPKPPVGSEPKPMRFSTIPPLPAELAAMEAHLSADATDSQPSVDSDIVSPSPGFPSTDVAEVSAPVFPEPTTDHAMPPTSTESDKAGATAENIEAASTNIDLDALTPDNPIFSPQRLESIPPLPPNPFKLSSEIKTNFNPPAESPKLLSEETPAPPAAMQSFAPATIAEPVPVQEEVEADSFETEPEIVEADQLAQAAMQEAAHHLSQPIALTPGPQVNFGPNVAAPTPQAAPQRVDDNFGLGEVTDQNYLTVLGRALDLIGWTDEQADSYSLKTFGIPHWDELGRSQAEKLVAHLIALLKEQMSQ